MSPRWRGPVCRSVCKPYFQLPIFTSQWRKSHIAPCSYSCMLSSPEPDNTKSFPQNTLPLLPLKPWDLHIVQCTCTLGNRLPEAPACEPAVSAGGLFSTLILVNICINGVQSFLVAICSCYNLLSIKVTNSELLLLKIVFFFIITLNWALIYEACNGDGEGFV